MSMKDIDEYQSSINAGQDLSSLVGSILPKGTYSKTAGFVIDARNPGVITYCPGGIDPTTGACRNTGLVIPDPLGHLAGALLLHEG